MNKDILEKVIKLFSTITDVEEINEDSEIIEDLDLSSIDVLFLISSLETEFKIVVPEREVRKMFTVGDVVSIIEKLI